MAPVTGTRRRAGRETLLLACVAVALGLIFTASSRASIRWVGGDYFGINFQQLHSLGQHARTKQLHRIAKLGIHQVRLAIAWPRVEPNAPVAGIHDYHWSAIDQEVAALAKRHIQAQLNITQTPSWDARQGVFVNLSCPPKQASSRAPITIQPYDQLTRAIAARYGRGGTFWRDNPSLPNEPVSRYEIWNEPNLRGGWCPEPQPDLYADMFVGAARAIHSVDRKAVVLTGGIAPPAADDPKRGMDLAAFFAQAIARQPRLPKLADGVAVHIYTATQPEKMLDRVAYFRDQLTLGGMPRSLPMLINEIGWPTKGGVRSGVLGLGMDSAPIVPEHRRAKAYRSMTLDIPRTNCNVMGITPQSWTSRERDPKNMEDWFGIANPRTGKPYRSARSYSKSLRRMRGETSKAPPRKGLQVCPRSPVPKPEGLGSEPTAKVAIHRAHSKHPVMSFKAKAGGPGIRNAKLKLPRQLRFARGHDWRKGVKARTDSRKLRRSAVRHTGRNLKVVVPRPKGVQVVRVDVRRHALRRVKPIHRKLRVPVVIRDADRQLTSLKLKVHPR